MGTARFIFTEDDLIAAQRAWWTGAARWQLFLKMVAIFIALYVPIILFILWDTPWHVRMIGVGWAILIAVGIVLIQFAVGFLLSPWRARRAFREHKALAGEFIYDWNADGVSIAYDHGKSVLPWTVLHDWMVGPNTLMLFQTSNLFNAIPRRALAPGDLEAIVAELKAAHVAERRRFGFLSWKQAAPRPENHG